MRSLAESNELIIHAIITVHLLRVTINNHSDVRAVAQSSASLKADILIAVVLVITRV